MKKLLFFVVMLSSLWLSGNAQTPNYYVAGASTSSGGNSFPWGTNSYQVELLYKPTMWNTLPPIGFITDIWFRPYSPISAPSSVTYTNLIIKMGNSSITSLVSGAWDASLTTVASYSSYTLTPIVSGQWFKVPLQTPFYFDNTQNFIINIAQSGTNGASTWYVSTNNINPGYVHRKYGPSGTGSSAGADGSGRPIYDFGIDLFAGYPCVGTPTSTVQAPSEVCPNRPFNVQPATFYSNATYLWEYSNNGTSWQFHPAFVGLYGNITDSITSPRWYRCTITCNATGISYRTPPWLVNIAPFYYCYCLNTATNAGGLDIGNVKVVNNTTNKVLLDNGVSTPALSNTTASKTYTNFQYSVPPVIQYRDTTYNMTVSEINSSAAFKSGNVAVFIDYNRDGLFDGTEKIMSKTINGSGATPNSTSQVYTVPSNAQIGLTGMRVILSAGNTDSCGVGAFSEGEVEDYLVDLRYEPCKGPVAVGTVDASYKTMCTGYDYVVWDSTYEKKKSEVDRMWQVSADNVYWYNVPNGANKDTLMRVFTGQPLYYRMRFTCTPTGDTTYAKEFKLDAKDTKKCYCLSQAIGGKFYDSSDVGGLSFASFSANSGGAHVLNPTAVKKRTDYTDDASVDLWVDTTYNFVVYHTMRTAEHGDAKVTIFMDYNNDKEYDIPYERVYTGYTSIGNYTLVDNIKIPDMVITEVSTGMRVILNNDIAPNNPSDLACGVYQSGETEDLMVTFHRKAPESVGGNTSVFTQFGMYPNPTTGKFRLQFKTDSKDINVTIKNVTGQVVMQKAFTHDGGKFSTELDMGNQARGVYFVELSDTNGEKVTRKLVLE